jgi:DNA-binding NtrC family response regulator
LETCDTELHQVLSVLPLPQPAKCSVQLAVRKDARYWVDIDAQPDPRNPRHTILYLDDVSEVYDLRYELGQRSRFHELIGQSLPMCRVYRQIQEVAPVDTTVLIEGETGTGKELVARAIHVTSPRRDQPFVALNCAGLGSDLVENQLFGHKRGAFTGAVAEQQGLFEAAQGGTLFLDEVGDLPLTVQTHLLRVLQEREITRLGETRPRKIDVRILAATQHDLHDAVQQNRFRADLLYRLGVVQITLPPLRQRPADIPLLVQEFVAEYRTLTGKSVQGVSRKAMQRLLAYPWPGNVRELRSVIESAVLRCMGHVIQVMDLPLGLSPASAFPIRPASDPANEKDRLLAALDQAGGNRRQAARLLGIGKSTLYRRFAQYGIAPLGQ